MKVVILAGGFGTRIGEESHLRPKPMIEIGGKPLLWHIMNIYSNHGIIDFIIAAGYKAEVIKSYFLNFYAINNDISIDLETGKTTVHEGKLPKWKIHIVDTGLHTQTGGRVKRLQKWLADAETFMVTYGDGLSNVDIKALLGFHKFHGKFIIALRLAFSGSIPPPFARHAPSTHIARHSRRRRLARPLQPGTSHRARLRAIHGPRRTRHRKKDAEQ